MHVSPFVGELFNPGYYGGYKLMDKAVQKAAA